LKFIFKHVDSNILIAAFVPDEKDRRNDAYKRCIAFLQRVKDKEKNTKLRISLTALGEVLQILLHKREAERERGLSEMCSYFQDMKGRLEPYSPKLKGQPENLHLALKKAGSCCEEMKDSQADASIVACAMTDPDAVTLYTMDTHLLSCGHVKETVREFRRENNLSKLRIRGVV
jgi:predicted nucleic acid-binding protein